ncbi:MAG: microcin C ABC transporter permease YejB [Pseudomonadota bacterium]
MAHYLLKRLLLMIPTLLGIMLVSFVIVQFVPGGPVERMISELQGHGTSATARFGGSGASADMSVGAASQSTGQNNKYRGSQGLDPEFIAELETLYGFDKPAHIRFFEMVKNYATFDLGESYYRDVSVTDLVIEKLPVSISLGLWSTLIIYLISIPLGIKKAVKDGQKFDIWTSAAVFTGYAIPSFMFAILLIILFASGRYFNFICDLFPFLLDKTTGSCSLFPLRGLLSDGWEQWPWWRIALDYAWHMVLPVAAMVISGFAGLTMLTKNSFLDEINKQYVLTARAKGLEEKQVLYGHIFRNAMLIVIAGFPSAFLAIFFTGSLLIEVIFSLDGLGLLGYKSVMDRDYPVVLGTLYIFALMGLITTLIRDVVYVLVDPRIDFEARTV